MIQTLILLQLDYVQKVKKMLVSVKLLTKYVIIYALGLVHEKLGV